MSEKTKKVNYKHVLVTQSEVTEKRVAESKYNKFQLWMARRLKIVIKDQHQYLFRVSYKGTARLKNNDIVCTADGIILVVLKQNSGIAMLVTKDHFSEKPSVRGKLTIIDSLNNGRKN